MRTHAVRFCLLLGIACVVLMPGCGQEAKTDSGIGRVRVTLPPVVLRGVPVDTVRIEAVAADGSTDSGFRGAATVSGLRIVTSGDGTNRVDQPQTVMLESGVAEFSTKLAEGQRVYIDDDFAVELEGSSDSGSSVIAAGFWSLLPPVVAIVLAIVLKEVYVALLAAVYSGALVLAGWNPWRAFTNILDPGQTGILAQASDSWNMQLIMFTLFLGAMIQVMSRSGGTRAVVNRLSRFTSTRERGQLLTWFMGLLVFFDDYANTMLVGGAMRPVTDRLRVSREKLAFLIDSTAAPIAGLAIVSTWVGVEVGYIGDGFESLGMEKNISYAVFLKTIPFRFYPMFLIAFVMLIAWTGRDFGPMLRAERDTLASAPPEDDTPAETDSDRSGSIWYAIIPVGLLVAWIAVGFVTSVEGDGNALQRGWNAFIGVFTGQELSFGDDFDSVPLLLHASMASALVACVLALAGRSLSISECADAWVKGMTDMFPAIVVLVLAWSVSSICKPGGLNTAGYIIENIGDGVAPELMPTLAFVISGAVAFAIGSSYTTMGLLIPLFMSLVGYMLATKGGVTPEDPLMLSSIGAILAGSIFGDHCSPISDTTVLSSAGARCNHLRHVATQMPYAITVGTIAIVFGYLPAGYGMNPWLMLLAGFVACVIVVRLFGRRAADPNPA